MPIGGNRLKTKWLDSDLCLALWIVCGSVKRVEHFLQAESVRNPESGVRFSHTGIHAAARRSEKYEEMLSRNTSRTTPESFLTPKDKQWAKDYIQGHLDPWKLRLSEAAEEYDRLREYA